jgi:DHA1 family tetracycline resistance protein-like MFS transporter
MRREIEPDMPVAPGGPSSDPSRHVARAANGRTISDGLHWPVPARWHCVTLMSEPANSPAASPAPGPAPRPPGRGSLLVIFLTVFIDLLGFGLVLPLLPLYGRQFAVDHSGLTLGLLMASFSAMQFVFAPLWGRLSDRIGRRPVLLVGLAGAVVFYTLFGLATVWESLVGLFIARIGAGIAGATIPTAQAYIADSTTLEGRVKGMALIGAAFGLVRLA